MTMEALTNGELIELAFVASGHISTQFQFWLSVTFALIVACFVAQDQLGFRVRIALAILYLTATFLIFYRMAASGLNGTRLSNEIEQRGIEWTPLAANWLGFIKLFLVIFDVSAAIWFLYSTYKRNDT